MRNRIKHFIELTIVNRGEAQFSTEIIMPIMKSFCIVVVVVVAVSPSQINNLAFCWQIRIDKKCVCGENQTKQKAKAAN